MNSETESLSLIIIVWGKPANKTTKHRREKKKKNNKKKNPKKTLHKQTKTAKGEQNFKGKRKQPPPPPQKKKKKKEKKRKAFTSLLGACGILSFYVLVPWSAAPNVVLHRLTDSP